MENASLPLPSILFDSDGHLKGVLAVFSLVQSQINENGTSLGFAQEYVAYYLEYTVCDVRVL